MLAAIADLDPAVQAKLLRVIETREVVPAGATHGTPVDYDPDNRRIKG